MKVVILIGGEGSNAQAILKRVATKELDIEVVRVISHNHGAKGLEKAQALGVDTMTVAHKDFATKEAFENALKQAILACEAELIILAGFMRVLSADFIRAFPDQIINIHPSLLPDYKGLNTHQRVLEARETHHGVSIHMVTEELDSGTILAQAKIAVGPEDTAQTLKLRVQEIEHLLYPHVIRWFVQERLSTRKNRLYLDGNQIPPKGCLIEFTEKEKQL